MLGICIGIYLNLFKILSEWKMNVYVLQKKTDAHLPPISIEYDLTFSEPVLCRGHPYRDKYASARLPVSSGI